MSNDREMTKEVAAMLKVNIQGNIIPHEWFNTVTKDTEKQGTKPDLMAIMILSDIVYWYKPRIEKDETTGRIVGYYRKFKADCLQKSYGSYAEMFGVSEFVVKQAILALEKLGVIKRELRNIKVNGMAINNVLFIRLFPEKLQDLSMGTHSKIYTPPSENLHTPIAKSMGDHSKIYTQIQETTTETTAETTESTNTYGSSTKKQLQEERFLKFWEAYPKKLNKGAARKAFYKINPDDDMLETFLTAIKKQSMLPDWMKDKGQFIPYPASWLNGERWEDDAEVRDLRMERIKSFRSFEVNE